MTDLYLQAMMHGILPGKTKNATDAWDLELGRMIDEELKNEPIDPNQDPFDTLQSKKAKLKLEYEEALKFSELSKHIERALSILSEESALMTALSKLQHSDALDETQDFQDILKIDNKTLDSIAQIGQESFSQGLIADSLALFTLLTTLSPENAEYWYRAGISAEAQEHYDLAIKLYQSTITLNPDLIGPKIFLIDCYLEGKKLNEAENAYNLAKTQSESEGIDSAWGELLDKLHTKIQESLSGGQS